MTRSSAATASRSRSARTARSTRGCSASSLLTNPKKAGDNYVTGTPGAVAGQVAGQVRSGALEDSGADATTSIVDMMQSMRAYESGQKVIQAIDDTLGKAASSVASVSG